MGFWNKSTKPDTSCGVVIVAAGNASRMNGIDKINALIDERPVIVHTLTAFEACSMVREVVVVCREKDIPIIYQYVTVYGLNKVSKIVTGGVTRQESVFNGVDALSGEHDVFLIHDGARPLVSQDVIEDVINSAVDNGTATAAVKVKDTIKVADRLGFVESTPSRESLYSIQTPQAFRSGIYLSAIAFAKAEGIDVTDDCQLVERMGGRVYLAKGDYRNIKITTPEDIIIAESLLSEMYL